MKELTLGTFLKSKRADKGLTQKELADLLGISRLYYLQLENGKFNNPRPALIRKIAEITNTPIPTINEICGGK